MDDDVFDVSDEYTSDENTSDDDDLTELQELMASVQQSVPLKSQGGTSKGTLSTNVPVNVFPSELQRTLFIQKLQAILETKVKRILFPTKVLRKKDLRKKDKRLLVDAQRHVLYNCIRVNVFNIHPIRFEDEPFRQKVPKQTSKRRTKGPALVDVLCKACGEELKVEFQKGVCVNEDCERSGIEVRLTPEQLDYVFKGGQSYQQSVRGNVETDTYAIRIKNFVENQLGEDETYARTLQQQFKRSTPERAADAKVHAAKMIARQFAPRFEKGTPEGVQNRKALMETFAINYRKENSVFDVPLENDLMGKARTREPFRIFQAFVESRRAELPQGWDKWTPDTIVAGLVLSGTSPSVIQAASFLDLQRVPKGTTELIRSFERDDNVTVKYQRYTRRYLRTNR